MTLVVRDEEDIVEEQLRYHFDRGIAFVIATDHRSSDGTTDILRAYEREGRLHLIRETAETLDQAACVTQMARLAAKDFGADWVINSDADEFWWPRGGSFAELLESVPMRFGQVLGIWRHFVLRPESDQPFYERMIWRRRPSAEAASPYHANIKALHRADPGVVVMRGNHKVRAGGLVMLREWFPVEVLHFPIRTREQMRRKFTRLQFSRGFQNPHGRETGATIQRDEAAVFFRFLVRDDDLAAGLSCGSLTRDVRLRDSLRSRPAHGSPAPAAASLDEDISLAIEVSDTGRAEYASLVGARVRGLDDRLAVLDRSATRTTFTKRFSSKLG